MEILKVASRSSPNSVAGAIAGVLEEHGVVELHAIGAGAVNQTVKAIAIAPTGRKRGMPIDQGDSRLHRTEDRRRAKNRHPFHRRKIAAISVRFASC